MTLLDQRVILNETDISILVNDWRDGSALFNLTDDQYAYIGAEVPFNNLYFDVGVANQLAASAKIDVWWGNAWVPVAEIFDQTKVGNATLGKSGRISWSLDWLKGWDIENETRFVDGLQDFKIYEMFWLRLSFTANLTATTAINYIGQKLCTERDLEDKYPDLIREAVKESYDEDKTTWDRQIYLATEDVIRALKARGKLWHRGQIFDHTVWTAACVEKTAELVYRGLGQAFENSRVLSLREFENALKVGYERLDKGMTGRLSQHDKRSHTVYGTR
jgi:hypothetical protein